MKSVQTKYFWQAVLFAVGFEGILILACLLMFGGPLSMDAMIAPSPTVLMGIPMLAQLLEGPHQVTPIDVGDREGSETTLLLLAVIGLSSYLLASGFYISLLSRTVRERTVSAWREALRSWLPLLGWMVAQTILGSLIGLLATAGSYFLINLFNQNANSLYLMIPGILSVILLLWFRYHFLYMEYASVLLRLSQPKTYNTALAVRRATRKPALIFFFGNLLLNIVLSLLINYFFSWPTLVIGLLLNVFLQTWMQQRLLTHFIHASEALEQPERTTSTDSQIPLY